jgi:hypothetical protein
VAEGPNVKSRRNGYPDRFGPVLPPAGFGQLNGRMAVAYPGSAVASSRTQSTPPSGPADGLLATLVPLWQIVIGGCVLVVLVAASARLARRGRSRMTTALLVTGAAVVGVAVIGVLTSRY